jgi:hypothetical protein
VSFDPNSTDAMFSRIMEKLERIEQQTEKTNGRVTALERDRWYQRGVVAAIALGAGAAWEWINSR